MWRVVLRRLLLAAVVVFLVSLITFLLLHLLPGGPARGVLGPEATPQQIEQFNHDHGFDQPVHVQYWDYLTRLLRGDLGASYTLNSPVGTLLAQRLPRTLLLTVASTLLAILVALPLGVAQAVRRNSRFDYLATGLTFVLYATPVFFLSLLLIIVFTQLWPVFPAQAAQGESIGELLSQPRSLVLPVIAGAGATVAAFSRYARASVVDNLAEDYVRTARAKGTPERVILWRHVWRNSLTSVVAMLGYYVPVIFGGALVVESMFNYPGVGLLLWNAARTSDYPVLLGVVLVIAVATVVGSLLADLAQLLIDPRVRTAQSSRAKGAGRS
ncbi:ABC transporter permease [Goodfellowiella coeruleoviolacea]|uniref:Peptide/nickel transport system permease protein n=1 Tax=Goodfellowiella coeruleoviolacea TaxID=334858 RepID=A0AAE3GCT7_9PSEU|nr:ABC transporter permease [Goodfellowiella coeruleoviolacea]MCP2165024.1 peptide/nickel transport system permease protein [Goodfellowiella coeruleoviolacea]